MRHRHLFVGILLLAVCGCETVTELGQPANVPIFVRTYEGMQLKNKTKEVPCMLNLVNCVPEATMVRLKFSGSREAGPRFPIREIVKGEFSSVLRSNFRTTRSSERPKIELKVESRKTLLERDGDDLVCEISLAVMLLNPEHEDKPYFSKTYARKAIGTMMSESEVPNCVYECVQLIADKAVQEINADSSLVGRLALLAD